MQKREGRNWKVAKKGRDNMDFKDHDCPKTCGDGKMKLARDTSYSKDLFVPTVNVIRKCASERRAGSNGFRCMTLEQVLKFTYTWVWRYEQQFIMSECRIGLCSTIVDWCNFAREVSDTILETECGPIGGVGKIVEIDESNLERGNITEVVEWKDSGYLEVWREVAGSVFLCL